MQMTIPLSPPPQMLTLNGHPSPTFSFLYWKGHLFLAAGCLLGDSRLSGKSTGHFPTWIQVGKLTEARLQITRLVVLELITCHFLIIPDTCFLPFKKLSPVWAFFLLLSIPLASCLILFILYCSVEVWEKIGIYFSIRKLRLFLQFLTDSFTKHLLRVIL